LIQEKRIAQNTSGKHRRMLMREEERATSADMILPGEGFAEWFLIVNLFAANV